MADLRTFQLWLHRRSRTLEFILMLLLILLNVVIVQFRRVRFKITGLRRWM